MTKPNEAIGGRDRAGYFLGFVLFLPALVVVYALFAAANWLFFGSLS